MNTRDLEKLVKIKDDVRQTLDFYATKNDLSARAYHRSIKLARTIADLEGREEISEQNILEAMQYRPKQKGYSV